MTGFRFLVQGSGGSLFNWDPEPWPTEASCERVGARRSLLVLRPSALQASTPNL